VGDVVGEGVAEGEGVGSMVAVVVGVSSLLGVTSGSAQGVTSVVGVSDMATGGGVSPLPAMKVKLPVV
jgi:hypothetical protein